MIRAIILIIITIFFPPAGAWLVAGCGADFLLNLCLTILGYFPGHIHAFYLEHQYYKRKAEAKAGIMAPRAPGVYSERIQRGGGYGTITTAAPAQEVV